LNDLATWETLKMNKTARHGAPLLTGLLAAGTTLLGLAGCTGEGAVSYARDVEPILQANCLSCHQEGGAGFEASGFSMASYDELMKGTQYGPMIIAGDSEGSNLVVLMEGRADPSISMPHGRMEPVARADIETIRRWIDQGAKKN
jgi:mono/diheme cytochrome c family protein